MLEVTRLNGEIIYLNYLQIEYIENIPETKIRMMNGNFYLVKDTAESIQQKMKEFMSDCIAFENKKR